MTSETFYELLKTRGIDRAYVRFNDSVSDDVFCVRERYGAFDVFYRERGKESGLKTFYVFTDVLDDLSRRLTPPKPGDNDIMNDTICGLEAELRNRHPFRIIDLLWGIPLAEYELFTPGGVACPSDGLPSGGGTLSAEDLERLSSPPYYVGEMSLYLFPRGAAVRRIKDYADYLQSGCVCGIMFYDCAFLAVYAKDPSLLSRFRENVKQMQPLSLCDKTEATDGRTAFL